ncbi:MAG TPA: TfpX/TfpZ family type IV pilin accessory protein [Usitatibacter sp.]|nr:TfpX/TfpZ family type IV pilin accessory protein [Usitatibacter sp.]
MNRFRAAAIHLGLSATAVATVFLVVYLLWYPGDLFASAGGRDLFLLVLFVDLTIGPMVTLLVFKPGKKGLVFDLWVIGLLQVSFLAYGVWTLSESRPVYIAFVKDRFELARANQVPDSVLATAKMNRYRDLPWTGPRLTGVRFPTDVEEKWKLAISGMAGVDIQSYPQYHVPYDEVRTAVVAASAPLGNLSKFNSGLDLDAVAARVGRKPPDVRFLPVRAGKVDLTALIDAKNGEVLKLVALKPWEYE